MKVITLAKTKELLGIADTASDAAITAAIPYIDSVVKQITRNRWNYRIVGDLTLGSKSVLVASEYALHYQRQQEYEDIQEYIETGMLISGEGIPDGAYVEEVYYNIPDGYIADDSDYVWRIDLSEAATETNNGTIIYLGIPIAYQLTIAKAVWWWSQNLSKTVKDDTWTSKTMGPVSVTRGGEKLDNRTGLPVWFISSLPRYQGGH